MPDFLVETYSSAAVPPPRFPADLPGLRHRTSIHVLADETSFHLVSAESADVVQKALRDADVVYERFAEAVHDRPDEEEAA